MEADPERSTVLFVCDFGSKKSLLAACYFNRFAQENGLPLSAVSRGLVPDPEVPDRIRTTLLEAGIHVGSLKPEPLRNKDLASAFLLVSFSEDLGSYARTSASMEDWSDMPALSDDFEVAHAAILTRVKQLVTELAEAQNRQA